MSSREYQYVSTFDTTQTAQLVVNSTVKSSSTNVVQTSTDTASPESNLVQNGDLAAFVSHVLYLENKLRTETGNVLFDTENEVFGSKVDIGEGASFRVQRAEWRPKGNGSKSSSETKWGKYVALKAVRAKHNNGKSDWREVISEVRCLLHEPLRYHPNLVRLLGIGWGPSADSSSAYPQLVMEFSEIGSMDALQRSNEPLPFAIKQKLCYDIGRGLSILHACGIIHGDLNHRNVLIFPNKVKTAGQPYTAKISDFGGSIMDVTRNDSHLLRMSTWPYGAPEIGKSLTEEGIKKTDVYSFGLLIWRTVLDCGNILHVFDLTGERSSHSEEVVSNLKLGDSFLSGAEKSIHEYQATKGLHKDALAMIIHALKSTIQYEPSSRDLTRTQCILNGIDAKEIPAYLQWIDKKNDREAEQKRARAPGLHGITPEGLGTALGRMGYDHDPQDNKPGYRPVLDHPEAGEFLFEPLRLKNILNWQQQQLIVKEFERAASMAPHDAPVELQPHMAAFYLFQCYLTEFGTTFDPERVVHWLSQASSGPEDAGGVIYYAQAWIWRISNAFDMAFPKPVDELKAFLKMSILRGHRTCLVDGEFIRDHSLNDDSPPSWDIILRDSRLLLNRIAAGLGMPYFAHRKLRRDYNLHDFPHLDDLIKQELGSSYNKCLKPATTQPSDHPQEASERPKPPNFESIFVNHIGHGLLHYAATMGNYPALLYMISKYQVDIDVKDQTAYETPLVCACRSGNFKCAMLLLKHGADPNDSDSGVETPLYWLCSFNGREMTELAQKLVDAGAYIDGGGKHTMRSDVRFILADWEKLFTVPVTNLGRAVIMNNIEAVRLLLKLGANPLAKPDREKDERENSAVNIAALLNLPEILETLLHHLDSVDVEQSKSRIFDEGEMLLAAHNKTNLPSVTTLLQSRLVRHGSSYKSSMSETLKLLHSNRQKDPRVSKVEDFPAIPEGLVLSQEVKLGNTDIVETLIALGHSPNGSADHRPIVEAVKLNHEDLFRSLIQHGADINVKYTLDDGRQYSLLQVFADRPISSRPGLFIAEYLLNKKEMPLDSVSDNTPSAFCLAVLNQDFELADLLLKHGENVNHTYQTEPEGPMITVLAELAQTHTAKNLASIEYLLSLKGQNNPKPVNEEHPTSPEQPKSSLTILDFIVDKTNSLSILHILSRTPHETLNNTAQTTLRIINTIVKTFSLPEQINRPHPVYGTPLCLAASTANIHMVSTLLEHRAGITIEAPSLPQEITDRYGSVGDSSSVPATPLHIALISACIQFMDQRSVSPTSNPFLPAKLRDSLQIVDLLYSQQDIEAGGDGSKGADFTRHQLQSWKDALKNREKGGSGSQRLGGLMKYVKDWGGLKKMWDGDEEGRPVNLWGMKDREGQKREGEMTGKELIGY